MNVPARVPVCVPDTGRGRALLLLCLTTACATAPAPLADVAKTAAARAPALVDVDLALLPDDAGRAGGVSLRYCARGAWPRRLAPENRRALPFLVSAVDDDGRALGIDAEGVRTKDLAGCAHLVVDVGRMVDTIGDRDLALRAGDDLVTTPDLWLWHPEPFDDGARLFLKRVNSKDGDFDVLLPWTDLDGDRLVVDASTFALKSDTVFGRFDLEDVDVAGARFRIARLDDGRAPAQFTSWLRASADAVAAVMGRYPLAFVNVVVVPTHVTQPIVVGFFSRGGGATATFFVGEGAPDIVDADLDATGRWALTHELSHPLLPPVKSEDAWLNEGLATWHQDLLARRAGLLKDDAAYWRELVRGLRTGAATAADDKLTLADASARMFETGAYQHAYFGGVAVMLLAEVEAQKDGASLDDLVRALRTAHPVDDRPRPAAELLASVTEGKGAVAARAVLAAYATHRRETFPSTADALASLGVRVDLDGSIALDDAAPLAAIRKRITQPLGTAALTTLQ